MRQLFTTCAIVMLLISSLTLATTSASTAAGVMEYELDYANQASGEPPFTAKCDGPALRVCFAKYGDVWWVKDTTNDGYYNLELLRKQQPQQVELVREPVAVPAVHRCLQLRLVDRLDRQQRLSSPRPPGTA